MRKGAYKEFKNLNKDLRKMTDKKLYDKELRDEIKNDSEVLLSEGRSLREVCRILSRKYEIKHGLLRNFLSGKTFKDNKKSKLEERKEKYWQFIKECRDKGMTFIEISEEIKKVYGEKVINGEVSAIFYDKQTGKKAEFDKDKEFEYDSNEKRDNLWTVDHERAIEALNSKKTFENPEVKKAIIDEVDRRLKNGEFMFHICREIAARYGRKWKCIQRLYKGLTYKKEFASEIKDDIKKIKENILLFKQMIKEKRSYAYIAEKLGLTSSHYDDAIYFIEKYGDIKIKYKTKNPL